MSKLSGKMSLLVVVTLIFAVLAGCGTGSVSETSAKETSQVSQSSESSKQEELKHVDLKLYCVGDASEESGEVVVEINKKLEEKLNTTLNVEYLPWANWDSKYQLLFASGEEFDAIYTAIWSFYATQATKNGFLQITKELLEKNAPNVLKDMPEEAWKQSLINGKIFMIPTTFNEYSCSQIAIRGDLREKHGIPEVKSLQDLEVYLDTIAKKEKGIIPSFPSDHWGLLLNTYSGISSIVGGGYFFYYDIEDQNSKPFYLYETDLYKKHVEMMYRFQKAGYFPKNALTDKSEPQQKFEDGQIASFVYNLGTIDSSNTKIKQEHPEWSVEVIDGTFGNKKIMKTPSNNSGIGIHATSENPERVLMLVDYARTNEELNNLFCYGIKDKHWTDAGDNLWNTGTSTNYGDGMTWIFRNIDFQKFFADSHPQIVGMQKDYSGRTVVPPLQSFIFDDSNYKSQMAALESVRSQYADPLAYGYVDPEKGIPELLTKLKGADIEKVQAELEKQATGFIETYNKPVW